MHRRLSDDFAGNAKHFWKQLTSGLFQLFLKEKKPSGVTSVFKRHDNNKFSFIFFFLR